MATIPGSPNNDFLQGTGSSDVITGGAGNDELYGLGGNDTLEGGDGDDFLIGGAGGDVLNGGAGNDRVVYRNFGPDPGTPGPSGIFIDLYEGVVLNDHGAGDTLISIEDVDGSDFNDTIYGSAIRNFLVGNGGNDYIDGDAGDDNVHGGDGDDDLYGWTGMDFMEGGAGADFIDGEEGRDILSYTGSNSGVAVNLSTGSASGGHATGDVFDGFEDLWGSQHSDTLTGDAGRNWLLGWGGNDVIYGDAGSDSIDGGAGDDTLYGGDGGDDLVGGTGNDLLDAGADGATMEGGAGADTLVAGAGWDSISYAYSTAGVSINLAAATASGGEAQGDNLIGDIDAVIGSAHADTITGNALGNYMTGGGGNDTMDGGAAFNTAVYSGNRADYSITTLQGGVTTVVDLRPGSPDGTDTLTNFTWLQFYDFFYTINTPPGDISATLAIVLEGSSSGTVVGEASATDPTPEGTVSFSLANDAGGRFTISASGEVTVANGSLLDFENQALHQITIRVTDAGGLYYDEVFTIQVANAAEGPTFTSFSGGASGVVSVTENQTAATQVSASDPDAGDSIVFSIAGGADASLFSIDTSTGALSFTAAPDFEAPGDANGDNTYEVVVRATDESGLFDEQSLSVTVTDVAEGGGGVIEGDDGANYLPGDDLENIIRGRGGNDILEGRGGADSLDGGEGFDQIRYDASPGGVTVSLAGGAGSGADAEGDVLISIESVVGSGFADVITGDSGQNFLYGLAGDDTLSGGAGIDLLSGGTGNDALSGGDDPDDFFGGDGNDTMSGGGGRDWFSGDAGDDAASGGADDDRFIGGDGADRSDGGEGLDQVFYNGSASGVTVNLLTGSGSGGDAAGDTYASIEAVAGSEFADRLTGNLGANYLYGNGGNDIIDGGIGDDYLAGGAGADTMDGGIGSDWLFGDAGNDVLTGGLASDYLTGGDGADTLNGGIGFDFAYYDQSPVAVSVSLATGRGNGGDAQGDVLSQIEGVVGSAYNDTLTGNTLDNTLAGNAGDDALNGGGGSDALAGGDGADSLNGGADFDFAAYWDSTAAVTVSLATGAASGGFAAGDTLSSIEGLIGSAFNDTLTGSSAANTLSGGGGDDVLVGGAGGDRLEGGDGSDTASYTGSAAVTVNLATGQASGGHATGDILSGIENLIGSGFADTLTGSTAANSISGGGGADTIRGGRGQDTLSGGGAGDVFDFDAVADSLVSAPDLITDWDAADRIDLSTIDARSTQAGNQAFSFIGQGAFTGLAGQLRFEQDASAGVTTVFGDLNGDGVADFAIQLNGLQTLNAADFIL